MSPTMILALLALVAGGFAAFSGNAKVAGAGVILLAIAVLMAGRL